MTFGARIKDLRKAAGMTQEQLANYLSVTPQAISRWENNTAMPDISQLIPIANLFRVTTDCLLGVDVEKNEEHIKNIVDRKFILDKSSKDPYGDKLNEFRSEIKKHPDSVILKEKMIELLTLKTQVITIDPDPADLREMSSLCEDILALGGGKRGEEFYRFRLLELAIELKNDVLVSDLLQRASRMRYCYELWLPETLSGPAKIAANKDLLCKCFGYALHAIYGLYKDELNIQEKEEIRRIEKLVDTFYGENSTVKYADIQNLYIPICAAMKVGELEEVYERLERILAGFRRRRNERPEFSALISRKQQLHLMFNNYLYSSIRNQAFVLRQLIQRDFSEEILNTDQMKKIMDELRNFEDDDTGMEAIAGREAVQEMIDSSPIYDIE